MGFYRPKFQAVDSNVRGKIEYGSKSQWAHLGEHQSERIKRAQFEENSKLCMCILRALDQGEVDIRRNKELKSQIYKAAKNDAISKKIALRNNLQKNDPTPKRLLDSDNQSHHSIMQPSQVGAEKRSTTEASALNAHSAATNDQLPSQMNFNKSQKSSPHTINQFPSVT